MAYELITPAFLENHSVDEIHKKMTAILPADIDVSEGGHVWNLTRSTALVAAELCEFILPEVIKLIFPEYSYDEYLVTHARARNITKHAATAAKGEITITSDADMVIPAGSLFSTASVDDEPSVDYKTLADITVTEGETVTVQVECTEAGTVGNTPENTIIFVSGKLTGITAVTNELAVTGGTDEEDDASLIERILEFDRNQNNNFVGSVSDYKRWATSVNGVGNADVIAAQDDSGMVTIVLTDANGKAATDQLCQSVYNYIMRPDNPELRLAPVNAFLTVIPPATMAIAVKATVELSEGATIESAKAAFATKLGAYLPIAMEQKEIKYTRVCSALSASDGVNDFANVQIGLKDTELGTSNIPIAESVWLPSISVDDIEFTVGIVS